MADESLYRVDGTGGDDNPLTGISLSDEIYGHAGADGQGSEAAEAIFVLTCSGVSINYDDVYAPI